MARKSPQRPSAGKPKANLEKTATSGAEEPAAGAGEVESGTAAESAAKSVTGAAADKPADKRADKPADGKADKPADERADEPADGKADQPADERADEPADRSLWTSVGVDPIEIALPSGVGYTLRTYRLSTDLTPTDISGRDDDDDPFADRVAVDDDDEEVVILDEEFAALTADETSEGESAERDAKSAETKRDDEAEAAEDDEAKDEAEHEEEAGEEVPFFLTHRGRLLLFKSPESLVAFVRSAAPHDLTELDTWDELVERIQPSDVAAADDDSYELDLVVENLRGGHDTWDLQLLIRAGEAARDLAYALRLRQVLASLAPGSPLDNLDEALRASSGGGIGRFMGRRRLRRIGAQQASISWRTIIGKISEAVDWRD